MKDAIAKNTRREKERERGMQTHTKKKKKLTKSAIRSGEKKVLYSLGPIERGETVADIPGTSTSRTRARRRRSLVSAMSIPSSEETKGFE